MGTPGVPLNFKEDEIRDTIKKYSGRMIKIAEHFDCSFAAMRLQIDRFPELIQLLVFERQKRDERLLEGAEDTLQDAMDGRAVDMNAALKSSFFVLNNKGKLRGYHAPNMPDSTTENKFTPQQIKDAIDDATGV